ncbi:MAG: hypothetical protein IT424_08250 [Pirellulales bacterium]|nr:hypothetical protein [Pirellulales bacterium]
MQFDPLLPRTIDAVGSSRAALHDPRAMNAGVSRGPITTLGLQRHNVDAQVYTSLIHLRATLQRIESRVPSRTAALLALPRYFNGQLGRLVERRSMGELLIISSAARALPAWSAADWLVVRRSVDYGWRSIEAEPSIGRAVASLAALPGDFAKVVLWPSWSPGDRAARPWRRAAGAASQHPL